VASATRQTSSGRAQAVLTLDYGGYEASPVAIAAPRMVPSMNAKLPATAPVAQRTTARRKTAAPAGSAQPGRPALLDNAPIPEPARSTKRSGPLTGNCCRLSSSCLAARLGAPAALGRAGVPRAWGRRFCPLGFATQGRLEHSREPVPSSRARRPARDTPAAISERAKVPSVQPDPAPGTPTTVLRLITRMNIGGPARQAILLTKGLSADFPTVLAAGRPGQAEGELTDPDVAVRHVPLVRPVRPATDLRCLLVVRRLLYESGARLVHTHMAKAGTIGRLAALSSPRGHRRPRLVHTFHGHVLQGYFAGPQQRAFVQFERILAKHTDVLIAVSPEVRDELLDLGIGKPAQYRVVPLGFDLAPLLAVGTPGGPVGRLRAGLGLAENVPLAGTVGRLVPVKDHATLFSAVASVPGLHLAVLGDGELRATLEMLARELKAYRTARTSRAGGQTSPLPWPTSTSWCFPAAMRGRP
jgi:hypothetical protein